METKKEQDQLQKKKKAHAKTCTWSIFPIPFEAETWGATQAPCKFPIPNLAYYREPNTTFHLNISTNRERGGGDRERDQKLKSLKYIGLDTNSGDKWDRYRFFFGSAGGGSSFDP